MINKIVIHCSDTPTGRDISAQDIHHWHIDRKWSGIGYHYVIRISGEIEAGRPVYWEGAHVAGHNAKSIGICLIGNGEFTSEQYDSLYDLIKKYTDLYDVKVMGHCDLDSKKPQCPGFDVADWLECHNFGEYKYV